MPVGYNQASKTCIFGSLEIDTKALTSRRTIYSRRGKLCTSKEDLTEFLDKLEKSIKKDGISRPLEVSWYLHPYKIHELTVNVGESRLYVARKLGIKRVPCWLCVYVYKINDYSQKENNTMYQVVEILKNLLPFRGESQGERFGVVPKINYER